MSIASFLMAHWEKDPAALKREYLNRLRHGTWVVEFVKSDGTLTTMECTLDPGLLPQLKTESAETGKLHNLPDLIQVYSIDRAGWRSFKPSTVKQFYPKPEAL